MFPASLTNSFVKGTSWQALKQEFVIAPTLSVQMFWLLAVLHQDFVSPPKKRPLSPGGADLGEAFLGFPTVATCSSSRNVCLQKTASGILIGV